MLAESLHITGWLPWLLLAFAAFSMGVAKTGVPGFGMLAVPILALYFSAKTSVGLMVPIMIFADLFAIAYYFRVCQWKHLLGLLPWTIVGMLIAFVILFFITDDQLKPLIGVIILILLVLRIRSILKEDSQVPHSHAFLSTMGVSAGVTTMLANAGGPVMTIYLLSMRLEKRLFVGTAAWFFFIVNWLKVPLMIPHGMITVASFKASVVVFPAVLAGALTGVLVIKYLPQKIFNIIALALAALAALKLLF
ncbi:MAG: sulfite exporter TauE/SafE family protein [Planctomycetaceae bacterium]|nr:sulfite exporter TauE/SafE family protein [Planctomycetaceae bacterium]